MTGAAYQRRGRTRRGRGALVLLTAFLLLSGMIRLGTGVGEALTSEENARSAAPSGTAPVAPMAEVEQVLAALDERERRLASREAALEERLRALSVSEERINAQMDELVAAERALSETLALADQASERDLERLTQVYENMKPADAAALFSEMDTQFAAGFIARMRSESAAAVMTGLPTNAAYGISAILAGRHVGVPTR
ncbi:MotE family protein [Alkalilacustris brevis]|uniref:MotE family protein n=1 Tax=Alkalilacustris brevis TaxID=2026338 RepID=UPI000E0CFC81|nr:hypothetical protein [Alkalilacustris brevis]